MIGCRDASVDGLGLVPVVNAMANSSRGIRETLLLLEAAGVLLKTRDAAASEDLLARATERLEAAPLDACDRMILRPVVGRLRYAAELTSCNSWGILAALSDLEADSRFP